MLRPSLQILQVDTPEDLTRARAIRHQVFVEEQGIPAELEENGLDEEAVHLLAVVDGEAVGTIRLVPRADDTGELARVAVLESARGSGVGKALVRELEAVARRMGLSGLVLHPHAYLEDFYRDLGYHTTSGTTRAGAHRLITMAKSW